MYNQGHIITIRSNLNLKKLESYIFARHNGNDLRSIIFNIIILITFLTKGVTQPLVEDFKKEFQLNAERILDPIVVDGLIEEDTWTKAEMGGDFWQKVPYFEQAADPRTEVRLAYDDDFLYVSAKCFQSQKVIIQSLRRDEYWDNDGIAIILDPQNTRTNAYLFGITAAGAQWDALNAQTSGVNDDWSNKWYSAVNIKDDHWSMEMAIPLRILRFNKDVKEWGMNFVRNHLNESEYHNWTAVPEGFWPPDPAFAGNLVWQEAPKPKKGNFNLIPYVSGSTTQTQDDNLTDLNVGLDARLSVTPTLNLDLTFNPDFSQIEVDELVTNLTRFSILLPEKRTFFLENNDLFDDFGFGAARPFVSRRIGLDNNRQTVPILYGMRLTGSLLPNTRMGLLNIHSLSSESTSAQNQTAFSLQQRFGRSFVQGMLVNRQGFNGAESINGDYGRNTSLEAAYTSDNGQIQGFAGMHHSFKDGISGKNGFYNAGFIFQNQTWEFSQIFTGVQENYFADLGFVGRIANYDAARDTSIRVGYNESVTGIGYVYRPKQGGVIARHNINGTLSNVLNPDWSLNERVMELGYNLTFRSRQEIGFTAINNRIDLLYPFKFVSEGNPIPAGDYRFSGGLLQYQSDDRKLISLSGFVGGGQFYNGDIRQFNANINFRAQPWGNFSLGYQLNDLSFPEEYGQQTITALLSKLEIGFNTNLLWTTLFQYVDQSDFMGINSRLQWRFAPMSDLFLVYIDNYDVNNGLGNPSGIELNNRSLIFKVNYWY